MFISGVSFNSSLRRVWSGISSGEHSRSACQRQQRSVSQRRGPVTRQFDGRSSSALRRAQRRCVARRRHLLSFGLQAQAAGEHEAADAGDNDILAEFMARFTPRQLHFKEGSTGMKVEILPRTLTRIEHCLMLQELVPEHLSVKALVERLCQGSMPVLKRFLGAERGRVLVFAGPWLTGLYGIELAMALAKSGYAVTMIAAFEPDVEYFSAVSRAEDRRWFCALRDSWQLPEQRQASLAMARQAGIEMLDFIPRTLDYYFDFVIDALVGADIDLYAHSDQSEPSGTSGESAGHPSPALMVFAPIIEALSMSLLPLISIDVPCGWDVLRGPRVLDIQRDRFLKPEILLCLATPKRVARYFGGNYIYLVGDVFPAALAAQRKLRLPAELHSDGYCLISVNPYLDLIQRQRKRAGLPDKNPALPLSWGKANTGELYGHPGEYIATVFSERVQREWVDVESSPDLWDEID
ncbi:hypothetical protein CCYA_CCYA06G1786 [Cyanidiococcus yangmingshanensis]|nr:hypothetical protein CCYA_CCYA06G1786 [Cyanidiococcus yangmingshanensis]